MHKASRYSSGLTYLKTSITTSQTYDRITKTKENSSIKQKKDIKPQNKKGEIQNQLENKILNDNKYIPIHDYLKCQWTKSSNQKT